LKCFYHDDLDGRCAGAIVSKYENQFNGDYGKECFFEVGYLKPLPLDKVKDGEKVYLVDYSFKRDTVWQLEKLITEMKCDVVWIDHHDSSLNLQEDEEYIWTKDIKGWRSKEASGAALTYMYLFSKDFDEIPYFVKLVSDYDCWHFKFDPDTTHFKLGIETEDYDALDVIWTTLLKEGNTLADDTMIKRLANIGTTIKGYIDKDNKSYRDAYAYETEIAGIKCLAVNRKSNSWVFGEKYNEYPIVMVYAFNGEKWSYSIFSGDKTVDCSKIAESYGGGGHMGAAGFSLDDMPFKKLA